MKTLRYIYFHEWENDLILYAMSSDSGRNYKINKSLSQFKVPTIIKVLKFKKHIPCISIILIEMKIRLKQFAKRGL